MSNLPKGLIKPHIGVNSARLAPAADNPREVAFATQWSEVQKRGSTLAHILGKGYTDRDAEVAATVIQWLGSNVGMSFIGDVAKQEPRVRGTLEFRLKN